MVKTQNNKKQETLKNSLMNPLIDNLRAKQKKGKEYFDCGGQVISYKTGFPTLDYYLGYKVAVHDDDDKIIDTYPSLGITCGSYVTFIGKPSTSKTTTAVQIAANIVRSFLSGSVIHFDLENSMNYSRIHSLTKFKMSEMNKGGKYILRQEHNTINDIKATIGEIYKEKISNPDLYKYNTGKRDEFGNDIILYEPTVIIIDSIAAMSTGIDNTDVKKLEEVGSQTERMRITGEISRFFTECLPIIRTVNIIVITINQIKTKASIGSFLPSPAEMLYLTQDETLPGGKAPQFYAHILCKFVAIGAEKYDTESGDGFDGFGVRVNIIKSRVNQAGKFVNLAYDKVHGIDGLRSSIYWAKSEGLTGGNKNKFYFLSDPDKTFTLPNIHENFKNDRELYSIMYKNIIPVLENKLSYVDEEELEIIEEEYNY